MTSTRHVGKQAALALACVLFACLATAQVEEAAETDDEEPAESSEAIDEIVVTAEKPGDRVSMETPYEELMKQRLLEEYDRMVREQEELAWRQAPSVEDPSRISFGYRPQDSRREDTGDRINTLPLDLMKPATVFRFEF